MWKKNIFELNLCFMGEGFVGIYVLWRGTSIYIVNVYSSCFIHNKRKFWSELNEFKRKFPSGEWCVTCNLNAIKKENERKGKKNTLVNKGEKLEFGEFIEIVDLVNVLVFTLFKLDGSAMSRIDRFLLLEELLTIWKIYC